MASSHVPNKSDHKVIFVSLFLLSVVVLFVLFRSVSYGSGLQAVSLTGCLNKESGELSKLASGSSPLKPCKEESTQVTLGNGTINAVLASTGLTGGGTSGAVTLGIQNNGITTSMLADGSVTPDKISNDASEPSRVQTWVDDTQNIYNVGALGSSNTIMLNTGISVTVPTGKAYYYTIEYDGQFYYAFSERANGSPGLNASWTAHLFSDSTEIGVPIYVVQTGYREDWNAMGNNNYWIVPYHASWVVRIGEGTHSLKVLFGGYSDNSMNMGHIRFQRMQVLRDL